MKREVFGCETSELVVAYDGTNYCGWQVQPNGITIEGVLNRELSKLLKEDIVVIGASRTDSGVHSYGNVAVFDTNARMPAEKISYAVWGNVHFLCKAVMAPASDAAEFFNTFQLKTHCSHIRRDILRGSSASASCRAVIFVLCIIVSHNYKKHQAEIECMIYARNSVQMNKNYLMRRNIQLESADERIF